jgi:hypothetical protein|tara:strand:- start:765 stop:1217 length:453 start_codon:yes stop_codon:yes gene_type:complete
MASKKEWGNIVWFLFHTLAYKLNNDAHISKLLEQIFSICQNLPCEDCAGHASSILKTVNVSNIKTRSDLIKLMLDFHNIINKRLGKTEYTIEQHNEQYSRAITGKIVSQFIIIMKHNNYTEKGMLHSFKKKQCTQSFIKYINENKHNYQP